MLGSGSLDSGAYSAPIFLTENLEVLAPASVI